MHRRRGEQHRHCGSNRGRRVRAVIFAREIVEAEFAVADGLPEEIRIEVRGERVCGRHRLGRARRREAQQNVRGLDFLALARNGFDLQRLIVIGEDRAGLELAVILEKNVHGSVCDEGSVIIPVRNRVLPRYYWSTSIRVPRFARLRFADPTRAT